MATNENGSSSLQRVLERIPLHTRMLCYGVSFLSFMLIALPWLAYRIDVYAPGWHSEIGWLRIVGVVLFVGFLGMYIFCSYVLSSRGRGPFVEFDPPREFVASGPYRWVRNPVAACLAGAILGLAIALSSTGVFLLFLLGLPLASGTVRLAADHGMLMTLGFLGTLISLERAVALGRPCGYLAPLAGGLGGLALIVGLPTTVATGPSARPRASTSTGSSTTASASRCRRCTAG